MVRGSNPRGGSKTEYTLVAQGKSGGLRIRAPRFESSRGYGGRSSRAERRVVAPVVLGSNPAAHTEVRTMAELFNGEVIKEVARLLREGEKKQVNVIGDVRTVLEEMRSEINEALDNQR